MSEKEKNPASVALRKRGGDRQLGQTHRRREERVREKARKKLMGQHDAGGAEGSNGENADREGEMKTKTKPEPTLYKKELEHGGASLTGPDDGVYVECDSDSSDRNGDS